ncbi:hypothetical protein GGI42DRAFT_59733 [Trichoderma sp. SZMC 28013]
MLVDDSSSAFSRHLESGLILLCSVCPMSLNYWFHLVQSMTCRCASLNVWVYFGLAAYAVCLRRSLCSFPGWRLFFLSVFFFSFFLSLFSFPPFFYVPGFPLRFSQIKDNSQPSVPSISMSARAMWAQIYPSLERSHAVSSGPKAVSSGIWSRNQRVPQLGVTGRAILGRQNNSSP